VPGVLEELSASATKVGVVELAVAMLHDTFVCVSLSQLGSVVGSVALPTVIVRVTVEAS
jgi:hypothetical protein